MARTTAIVVTTVILCASAAEAGPLRWFKGKLADRWHQAVASHSVGAWDARDKIRRQATPEQRLGLARHYVAAAPTPLTAWQVDGVAGAVGSAAQHNAILDAHLQRWGAQLPQAQRDLIELLRYRPPRADGRPPSPTRGLLRTSLLYDALSDYSSLRGEARVTHVDPLGPGSYRVHFTSGRDFGHYHLRWSVQDGLGRWRASDGRLHLANLDHRTDRIP